MSVKEKHLIRLRTCASCEWIFKAEDSDPTCPKCGFGSYSARYVYGNKAYTYLKTQKPYKDKKMFVYKMKLDTEIQKDALRSRNTKPKTKHKMC